MKSAADCALHSRTDTPHSLRNPSLRSTPRLPFPALKGREVCCRYICRLLDARKSGPRLRRGALLLTHRPTGRIRQLHPQPFYDRATAPLSCAEARSNVLQKAPSAGQSPSDRTVPRPNLSAVKASSIGAMIVSAALRRALLASPAPKRTAVLPRYRLPPLLFRCFPSAFGCRKSPKQQRPIKNDRFNGGANHHRYLPPGRWESLI